MVYLLKMVDLSLAMFCLPEGNIRWQESCSPWQSRQVINITVDDRGSGHGENERLITQRSLYLTVEPRVDTPATWINLWKKGLGVGRWTDTGCMEYGGFFESKSPRCNDRICINTIKYYKYYCGSIMIHDVIVKMVSHSKLGPAQPGEHATSIVTNLSSSGKGVRARKH